MTRVCDVRQIGVGMIRLPQFDGDERRYVVLRTRKMDCCSAMDHISDRAVRSGSANLRFEFFSEGEACWRCIVSLTHVILST